MVRYLPSSMLRKLEIALWGTSSVMTTDVAAQQPSEEVSAEEPVPVTIDYIVEPVPRLEDLIQQRRQADLSAEPLLDPARYLARLRRTRRQSGSEDDEDRQGS